jgi:hypothetical protein
MHPILEDNLSDFSDKAADLAESNLSGKATKEFVLSGYRLYRNFAVLLAAGYIPFAEETARAILACQTLESKEAMPEFFRGVEPNLKKIDIEDLGEEFDYSEHMLVYEDGAAMLQNFDFPDTDEDTDEDDDDGEDEDEGEADDENEGVVFAPCGCDRCSKLRDLRAVAGEYEATYNRNYAAKYGEEASPARQDYHKLVALEQVGFDLTGEEQIELANLRGIIIHEAVQRVVRQKMFETARARQIAADNAAREAAAEVSESDKAITEARLSDLRSGYVSDSMDEPISATEEATEEPNLLGMLCNTLVNVTDGERALIAQHGGVASVAVIPLGPNLSLRLASGARLIVPVRN